MKKAIVSACAVLACLSQILAQNGKNPPAASADIIQKGVELHDKGEYREAINLYKQVHRSDTNYVWARYELGLSYTADSQLNNAVKVYEEALGLTAEREREPELYTNYASLIDDMGDAARALRIYDSALAKYPAYAPLYVNKATTLYRQEKFTEAETLLKKVLLMDPYSYSSHYMLALCQFRQGRLVPAFMGFTAYLMVSPQGKYYRNCITFLSAISRNTETVTEYTGGKLDQSENYKAVQDLVLAKLALNSDYKLLTELDDPISRQIQVVFEKLEYRESDNDFYMQYYVPLYKKIFQEKKFEYFINHVFSNVDLEAIQDFNKKNEKEIQSLIEDMVSYLNLIRASRELTYSKREKTDMHYTFSQGSLVGAGRWKNNGEIYLGKWDFFYGAGNMKSTGSYNNNGEREGQWTYYFFTGNLKGKEFYKNGKLHGECVYYYSNGNISSKENYKDGELDGLLSVYYLNSNPSSTTYYKKGKREGERKEYSQRGFLNVILNYKGDSLHGNYKSFHPNGKAETIASYTNGKLHGPVVSYHANGTQSLDGNYADGKYAGTWKRYYENGKPKTIEPFVDGSFEGEFQEFHRNGVIYARYNYKKGKLQGDVTYFTKEGKPYVVHTYDDNVLKAAKYSDLQGKVLSETKMNNGTLELVSYTSDGYKRMQATYNDKNETVGTETYFYPSGKPSQTSEYADGVMHGKNIAYHHNGKKKSALNYTEGTKNGYYTSYFPHGTVQQEGWYVNDMAEDYWTFYNEHGAKTTYSFYYNDAQDGVKEEFWPNGNKEFETWYVGGIIEKFIQYDTTGKVLQVLKFPRGNGKFSVMTINGQKRTEGKYVNGDLDGVYKIYFPDGSLESIQSYRNGLNDSIYRSFQYGGLPNAEGQYRLGEKTGTWKYYRNGKLQTADNYENGMLHGIRYHYYEDGKVDSEINFDYDEREGLTKKFAPDGSLIYQLRYSNGLPVAYTYPDKDGKLLPEIPIKHGTGAVKTYYPNGTVSAEFSYIDGKLNGADNSYFPNGKPWMQSFEDYGSSTGAYKIFYSSGQLRGDYTYAYGNLHGNYKEYNEKGILTEEGNYYNGFPHGIIKQYGDDGKLKVSLNYYYGQILSVKK